MVRREGELFTINFIGIKLSLNVKRKEKRKNSN